MSSPDAPEPIDYIGQAHAQGQENRDTAQYNAALNRVDQTGPYGSKTYSLREGADTSNPQPGDWLETTSFSPTMQGIFDTQNNLTTAAQARVGAAQNTSIADSFRTGSSLGPGQIATWLHDNTGSTLTDDQLRMQTQSVAAAPNRTNIAASQIGQMDRIDPGMLEAYQKFDPTQLAQLTGSLGPARALRQSVGDVGKVGTVDYTDADKFNTELLNTADYQLTDRPEYERLGEAGKIRDTFDASGVRAVQASVDDTSRRRVEQALLDRMNPMLQQQENSTRNQLLNAGMEIGTEGYNRELDRVARGRNDAYLAAIAQAGQEESRQVGLNRGLQQDEFSQAYQRGTFGQTADIGNNQAMIDFNRARNNDALSYYKGVNEVGMAGARFNQETKMGDRRFQMEAQQGNLDNRLATTGFNNTAQQQMYNQGLASAQLYNQAAMGDFQNEATQLNTNNDILNKNNTNALDVYKMNNMATLGNNNNVFDRVRTNNAGTQANFDNLMGATNLNNTNVDRDLANRVTAGTFNNDVSTAEINARMMRDAQNTGANQQVANAFTGAQNDQFQRDAYLRGLPMAELAALQNNSAVQMPQFGQVAGATAGAAPVMDASIAAGTAAQQQYQQDMASYNSTLGAGVKLAGGIGSLIFSDKRLKENITRIGDHPAGVGRYAWDWKDGSGSSSGVLAQELQKRRPDAVAKTPSGFLAVDYAKIGGR